MVGDDRFAAADEDALSGDRLQLGDPFLRAIQGGRAAATAGHQREISGGTCAIASLRILASMRISRPAMLGRRA